MRYLLSLCLLIPLAAFPETFLEFRDSDFEEAESGWKLGANGMGRILADAARAGERGLRVIDESEQAGSDCRSSAVSVVPGRTYGLRFQARTIRGVGGVGVYLQFADQQGKGLNSPSRHNEIILVVPTGQAAWKELALYGKAPEGAVFVTVWVHSFNGSKGAADFDDFQLAELTKEEAMKISTSQVKRSSRAAFPAADPARVEEIAAMLSESGTGLGRPASDREVWDVLSALPDAAQIVKSAESCLNTPPPEVPDELYLQFSKTGNRTGYQRPYGQRSGRIHKLMMGECLENQGRFVQALERDVLAMCDERSWTMPAHDAKLTNFEGTFLTIDLGSVARAWLLSSVDWWLGAKLSPAVRQRLRSEVRRRVLDVYMAALDEEDTRGNWWMKGNNNWNAVCTAGVVSTALNLLDSRQERARILAAAELSNPYFLSGFTEDGYCSEGMGYWNYGFGHFMALGLAARAATGGKLDFFQGEKLERIAAYARAFQIEPGRSPWFADGGGNPSAHVWSLVRLVYPDAVPPGFKPPSVVSGSQIYVSLRAFGQEPTLPESDDVSLPIRDWFAEAQILLSRSVPGVEVPFGVAIKGGHNAEHHNHNDVGSFTIMLGGEAFVLDPGGEVYTRRTFSRERYVSKMLNSYGHPVPVVGGELQVGGRSAAAKLLGSEFTDELDRLTLDISGAYRVPEMTKLVRTFVHDRSKRVVTVTDEFEFDKPTSFGTALPTYSKYVKRDKETILFYTAKGCLQVDATIMGGEWQLDEEEIENPNKKAPTRLGFNFVAPVLKGSMQFVFRPVPLPDDLPGFYHDPKWDGAVKPDPANAITVEAEAFSAQTGGEVTLCEKPGASGRAFKFWDHEGHSLEYTFEVREAGRYAVQLRACGSHSKTITRKVWVDGNSLADGASFVFPDTGGWSSKRSDWRDVYLEQKAHAVIVDLKPGKHVLRMENDCGVGLNLDWVRLVPVR
ncbi:MAG: heparinase II/III family protein [Lentisphaeria bacterium]|nr:heparinase II/III family protein [Lentisphaeria bacterium]